MKPTSKTTNAPKSKTPPTLILLSLAACLILALGCQQTAQTPGAAKPGASPDPNNLSSQALRIIVAALADPEPMVRVNAIEVVVGTNQVKLMPKVQRLLQDPVVPVRFAAALAIGDLQYSLGKNAVTQLLRDRNHNVVIAASYAMTRLGAAEYAEIYRKTLESKDQTVRANSALLLGKAGDRNALKLLYWALREPDSDDKVLFQAAESIAMLGDEKIYPRLWTMLISAQWDLRLLGVKAMAALKTTQAKDAVATMLDDDILEVRLAAAEQLARLKDPVGEPNVLEILQQNLIAKLDSKQARERASILAAKAIGRLCTKSLTGFLPQMLASESKFVQITAAEAVLNCKMNK